jgi:hypothetical protein
MRWSQAKYVENVESELHDYRARYLVLVAEIAHALHSDQAWARDLHHRLAQDPNEAATSLRDYVVYRYVCAVDIERVAARFPAGE